MCGLWCWLSAETWSFVDKWCLGGGLSMEWAGSVDGRAEAVRAAGPFLSFYAK